MDKRTAKREACWRAASALRGNMDHGWPLEMYDNEADGLKVSTAILELIDELERRGSTTS